MKLTRDVPYRKSFGEAIWTADLNGDGCDDAIVSDPGVGQDIAEGGEVLIYYGSPIWLVNYKFPDITIPCPYDMIDSHDFGWDLGTVDFDFPWQQPYSDTVPDLVIGCPGRSATDHPGKVLVYEGPDYFDYVELPYLLSPLEGNNRLGSSLTVGDFNLNDEEEIVAGAYAYDGKKGKILAWNAQGQLLFSYAPEEAHAQFGWDLTSGDLTLDGYPDLVISAVGSDKVHLSYGRGDWGYPPSPFSIDETINPPSTSSRHDSFGISVSQCGMVDYNGITNLAVGASQENLRKPGYVVVYPSVSMSFNGGVHSMTGEAAGDQFGREVNAKYGDWNGLLSDIAISAPFYDDEASG